MNKLTLLALGLLAVSPAFAQDKMMGDHKMMGHMQGKMDPMMGLTPAEKKVAMMHMKKMSPAEMSVMKKIHMMRMMGKSQKEAMMGLTKPEMATANAMMKKMSPMEMKVAKKMMDHAQMMGKGMKKPMTGKM